MASPQPSLPPPPADERIVVMPTRYRGAALGPIPTTPQAGVDPRPGRRFPTLVVGISAGAMVLAGLAAGTWWLLSRSVAPQPAPSTPTVSNTNANRNTNRNTNVNGATNTNANRNVNAPAASTTPAGLFPEAEVPNTSPAVVVPAPTVVVVRNAPDNDADGLTDTEERSLYGSDPAKPDSDGDGYIDGEEVLNGYSPTTQKQTLLEVGRVRLASESAHGVRVLVPTNWTRQVVDAETGAVAWISPDGDFVQLFSEVNPQQLTPAAWYASQSPGVRASSLQSARTASGILGVRSLDGLTVYLSAPDGRIVVLTYNIGTRTEAVYRRTFEMVLTSLSALPATAPASAPTTQ